MTGLLAPGLYRQLLDPVRPDPVLVRGDIAALLGYALRGPAGAPVRVSSLREFEDVYGSAPTSGYLWHAVKGFFETGGRSAYVVRIVTDRARAARNDGAGLELIWRATASFPWTMIDPRRPAGAGPSGSEGWEQVFERQLLESGPRSDDPGGWGNGLSLRVRRTSVVRTATLPEVVAGGTASRFGSLAGVHPTSVLELSQTVDESPPRPAGRTVMVRLLPLAVDTDRRLVHWGTDLAALQLDPRRPIRVASVEFDIDVHREGRLEQSFTGLAPHPGHPASISAVMAPGCRSLELRPVTRRRLEGGWQDEDPVSAAEVLAGLDWADHGNWPQEGDFALSGGADGLEDMSAGPWLDGLRAVGRLPDAALIAVPDLVLVAEAPPQVKAGSPDPVDCSNLFPAPPGQLTARVTGTDPEGATVPVPGALVDVAGPGAAR